MILTKNRNKFESLVKYVSNNLTTRYILDRTATGGEILTQHKRGHTFLITQQNHSEQIVSEFFLRAKY